MQSILTNKRLLLGLLLFTSLSVFSQSEAYKSKKISAYSDYYISSLKNLEKDSTQRTRKKRSVENKTKTVEAYIELRENTDFNLLNQLGVKVNSIWGSIITAEIPFLCIEKLAQLDEVKRIEFALPVNRKMDEARKLSHVTELQRQTIGDTRYTGKGVIIGVIDGGFDYNHINFKDKNGNLRIKRVWDQNSKIGKKPQGYSYGTEYSTAEEILNAQYDATYSDESHGNHVLGIAAGADKSNNNTFFGVAPEAEIVLVSIKDDDLKGRMSNVSISNGIKYIYDYADSVGKACVINLSLGSHFGPHDGSSTFDQLADKIQGKGRLLVGAAGNEAEDKIHVSKHIHNSQDTLKTLLYLSDYSDDISNIVEIWGEENENFSVQLIMKNIATGKERNISPIINTGKEGKESIPLNVGKFKGKIELYTSEINKKNKRHNILIINTFKQIASDENIGLKIFNTSGNIHAWFAENGEFENYGLTTWREGNEEYTIGEIGGTGKRIISVGAFVSKKRYKNLSGEQQYAEDGKKEDIADFSSIGPTLDGRMKPEITAPGTTIVSSYSGNRKVINTEKNRLVKKTTIGNKNYYYGTMEGTSMAAPHVTGILALWLEANKELSPEDVRNILEKTATKDNFTGNTANNEWGYGKINAYKGLIESLRLKGIELEEEKEDTHENTWIKINFTNKGSKTLEIRKLKEYLEQINIRVWSIDGKMVLERNIAPENMATITVDLSAIPHGMYIIKIQGKGMKNIVEKIIL